MNIFFDVCRFSFDILLFSLAISLSVNVSLGLFTCGPSQNEQRILLVLTKHFNIAFNSFGAKKSAVIEVCTNGTLPKRDPVFIFSSYL